MIDNEIRILTDKEHVIRRPGMYIGSVSNEDHERFIYGEYKSIKYVPGLIKLVDEIIDNSVDEAIRTSFKFANKIEVSIDPNTSKVIVSDNGRGLPQNMVTTPEGDVVPAPVAAWTRTKTGGNFGDDSERVTGGQNGVGSSLTNIFSTLFKGVTSDGKNEITVYCSDGAQNISHTSKKSSKKGTMVEFVPDFTHFETNGFSQNDVTIIRDRVQTLAVIYPDIEFKFNGHKIQGNFKKYAKMYDEHAIIQEQDNCSLAVCRSPDGFRHLTYVNNIHTKNGGHHIDCVIDDVAEELIPAIKRKYKIEVNKSQVKNSLTIVMFVRNTKNMRFDSQTKERFTSPHGQVREHIALDVKKISNAILKSEEVLMPIIESALARKLAAEKAAETKANKKAAKAKVAKHIKPNKYGNDQEETTLFLTEGDSAIGYLIEARNGELHGGYPLRGKFINTWGMTSAEILKNKEAFDICAITGLTIGEKAESLNYKNIAIMTDADVDGTGSIYPSLLQFFSNWPELFEQGRIRFTKTPVIIAFKKNDQKWFYNLNDFDAARDSLKGYDIRYIKGLGSLTLDEYEKVINQPVYDVVRLPEDWKDQFKMLFGNDSAPRKVWMMS